ncbi:MAG: hypothetical protein JKY42_00680 [Flavobacteriales bacterium]|nr:hypothetical protein [Flavobacteriales bacterium]
MKEFDNWKKDIEEISGGVWKITITHDLGPKIELTGTDLGKLNSEIEISVIKVDQEVETAHNKSETKPFLRSIV